MVQGGAFATARDNEQIVKHVRGGLFYFAEAQACVEISDGLGVIGANLGQDEKWCAKENQPRTEFVHSWWIAGIEKCLCGRTPFLFLVLLIFGRTKIKRMNRGRACDRK